jgi:hypothetical protein
MTPKIEQTKTPFLSQQSSGDSSTDTDGDIIAPADELVALSCLSTGPWSTTILRQTHPLY